MANIVRIDEQWKGTGGSVSTGGDRQVRKWKIEFDAAESGGRNSCDALVAPGLPHIYDLHPHNRYIMVLDKQAQLLSPTLVEVVVNYGVRAGSTDDDGGASDPLSLPVELSFSDVNDELPVDVDIQGAAIVNSSLEAFDPPLTKPSNDKRMQITKNIASYRPGDFLGFKDAINSTKWEGFEVGTVRYLGESATRVTEGETTYWRVTHELQIRRDGWVRKILDQGYREKTGKDSSNKPTFAEITDTTGKPVSQPVLLNGSGGKLADGAKPEILEFVLNDSKDFSVMKLLT